MVHGIDEVAQAGEQSERITVAFLALAWIFILLRIWTRTWVIASFGWDDATMILAGVCIFLDPKTCGADMFVDDLYGFLRIAIIY